MNTFESCLKISGELGKLLNQEEEKIDDFNNSVSKLNDWARVRHQEIRKRLLDNSEDLKFDEIINEIKQTIQEQIESNKQCLAKEFKEQVFDLKNQCNERMKELNKICSEAEDKIQISKQKENFIEGVFDQVKKQNSDSILKETILFKPLNP
ncbi:hypothetical protein RF11_10440 [Thelohanellus kitauei]|uniref:Uncharacterized protein n=1 Tax=Thelohanellus kitauei TaxID=669202 RepID=A0A0C2NMB4_THEKT|nr:hypothetical protein RF11_10440 [Thelohanellus kitauei]